MAEAHNLAAAHNLPTEDSTARIDELQPPASPQAPKPLRNRKSHVEPSQPRSAPHSLDNVKARIMLGSGRVNGNARCRRSFSGSRSFSEENPIMQGFLDGGRAASDEFDNP
jgi:hypothetical protein